MSDLLTRILSNRTPSFVQGVAGNLGESETSITKALGGMVPTLLASMIGKSSNSAAMNHMFTMLTDAKSSALLDNLETLASNGGFMRAPSNNDIVGKFVKSLLGDKASPILSEFSSTHGLKISSLNPLMFVSAQLVMGHISRSITSRGLEVGSFFSILNGEKDSIISALPPSMIELLGLADGMDPHDETTNSRTLPFIVGIITVGLIAFWAWKNFERPKVEALRVKSPELYLDSNSNGAVKATDPEIRNGRQWFHKLDNGHELIGDSAGIERNLFQFISSNRMVDMTTWFNCDHLVFDTRSSTLDMEQSRNQLTNIAEIMKMYPKVRLKIGGYTDSSGNSAENMKLSQERADAVFTALITIGVSSKRMEAEGYGDQYPVAGNNTEVGRSQNRRIALRVTAK